MPCSRITRATRLWLTRAHGRRAVVELGGDPRRALRRVPLVHDTDPFGQLGVRGRPLRPAGPAVEPGVERGTCDLKDLAQPLHPVGVPVVSDEPEATHQFVSPAKYLAARRRISRSVTSLACSATSSSFSVSSAATRARNAASSSSGDSPRRRPGPPVRLGCDAPPAVASAPAAPVVAVWARTHSWS